VKKNITRNYTLLGVFFGLLFPLCATVLWVLSEGLPLQTANLLLAQQSDPLLWIIDSAPLFLGLFAFIAGLRHARVQNLSTVLNERLIERQIMLDELERLRAGLLRTVNKQVNQLQTAALVARDAAAIHNLPTLLSEVVHLISTRFGFYHTGIFLIDETGQYAVLQAASSPGGQRMLDRQHKLKVGEVGIVGYAAGRGEPRIALDVGADAVYFNNPDLPETRSEIALPLQIHNQIIGVLDVQSTQEAAFTEEDVEILQLLSDQLALAIHNARLFEANQAAYLELEARYAEKVGRAWQKHLRDRRLAFHYNSGRIPPVEPLDQPAGDTNQGEASRKDPRALTVPITLRGHNLGALELRRTPDQPEWTDQERFIAAQVCNQLSLALENARLIDQNRQRAQHEQIINRVAAQAQKSLDIESVMRTAVEEIGRALGLPKVQIRLQAGTADRQHLSE